MKHEGFRCVLILVLLTAPKRSQLAPQPLPGAIKSRISTLLQRATIASTLAT